MQELEARDAITHAQKSDTDATRAQQEASKATSELSKVTAQRTALQEQVKAFQSTLQVSLLFYCSNATLSISSRYMLNQYLQPRQVLLLDPNNQK